MYGHVILDVTKKKCIYQATSYPFHSLKSFWPNIGELLDELPPTTITGEIIARKWFEVCRLISVLIPIQSPESPRP
jgi:hypothetical protein